MKKQTTDVVREYHSNVFWSDDDDGFIATAPDLPGCSAFGPTQVQALAELHHAIDAWIEAAMAAGNRVPQPSRPPVEPPPSGMPVRMPKSLQRERSDG